MSRISYTSDVCVSLSLSVFLSSAKCVHGRRIDQPHTKVHGNKTENFV